MGVPVGNGRVNIKEVAMILTRDILPELRKAYEEDCIPVIEIAGWLNVTRAAVYKFFKKHGIDTRKGIATQREVKCDGCGKDYKINRAQYRNKVLKNGTKKHFCSDVCYFTY